MKAVISSTYDDLYLPFLPITTWLWNKLGVEVICFMPYLNTTEENKKIDLINDTFRQIGIKPRYCGYASPKDKEATYAQCSRLYAACLDLPEDEFLLSSDIDMAVFALPIQDMVEDKFVIFGSDLTPPNQYPICYAGATVKVWRDVFGLHDKTYQQCLDDILGAVEAEHFRGNYWGKDQETLYAKVSKSDRFELPRSNGQNQFATKRYDRDDTYILDRLNPDTIDFHMNRPCYEPQNSEIILKILQYHYPHEDFTWVVNYLNAYKQLI